MDLDIPGEDPPIGRGEGGPQKVRPRPVVPNAGVMKPDRLARHCRQRIPNQLLKPDPLEDGLRQNRPRLFPEKIRPDPLVVSQTHKGKTTETGKGCGRLKLFLKTLKIRFLVDVNVNVNESCDFGADVHLHLHFHVHERFNP